MSEADDSQIDLPWGPRDGREPMFNAPWTLVVLCAGLIGLYVAQRLLLDETSVEYYALSWPALREGRWQTLISALFLHESWAHVLMNSIAALAFGPPTARLLGVGARGALLFTLFYLLCGVIAGGAWLAIHPHDNSPLIGASGAISGLLGAAARLIEGRGRVGPLFGRTVIGMTVAWVVVNALLGISGMTPFAHGVPVAWQAHVAGYFAGLLLIGPFARLARPTDFDHVIER